MKTIHVQMHFCSEFSLTFLSDWLLELFEYEDSSLNKATLLCSH